MSLIDPPRLLALLADARGRFDVDALDSIDSTNAELLRRAAQGAASGSVLVADEQTAGRGRRGRSWLSSPQDSLTFSLLWRFPGDPTRLLGLPLVVGVALADAFETLGARDIQLKWPNDVLLASAGTYAKLAGVLVETVCGRGESQVIIGIGINLCTPRGELLQPAAGLDAAGLPAADRHAVLAGVLRALACRLDAFASAGFLAVRDDWQARHAWQAQPVRIMEDGAVRTAGVCRGVDAQGALLLETAAGLETVHAGDVSLRPA